VASTPVPGAAVETAPGAFRCSEGGHQGDHPAYADLSCWENQIGAKGIALHGGLELDVGYAEYGFADLPDTPELNFYDLRGRFVLGVDLRHDFGKSGYYVGARGQLVGWAREVEPVYQINVDDVYGEVGHTGGDFTNWDVQLGRLMTWRVFHKGLGFDLYTLEDCGAFKSSNLLDCGVHTYEVNFIYLRNSARPIDHESAGRLAVHYFPHRSFGAELAGVYGQVGSNSDNTAGGRLALDFHRGFGPLLVRLSAGGEYRFSKPAKRTTTEDPTTKVRNECLDCNFAEAKGAGGSVIVKVGPVELSGSVARGYEMRHKSMSGANNPSRSDRSPQDTAEQTSMGGYLELDPGKYVLKHSVILGAGLFRTERIQKTDDYQIHYQAAGYLAVPLGVNDAMVKLVVSRAELDTYNRTSAAGARLTYQLYESSMTAARLRFKYSF
jgi:hypothetical protein